jgi:hypothetical protein
MKPVLFLLGASAAVCGAAEPTLSWRDPELLPHVIPGHAATRLHDWDGDGDADLLVGGGDGRVWISRNVSSGGTLAFDAPEPVSAGGRSSWGESYVGATLAEVTGDARPDLVVAHSGNRVSIHENRGEAGFAESGREIVVQDGCQGRCDLADWNGDGRPDLITGSFHGTLQWHVNQGDGSFGPAQPFQDIRQAYNLHPRVLDFTGDGRLDLVTGINWGTVQLFPGHGSGLGSPVPFAWASDGRTLNLRDRNGDDTTPDFADLDGDGVLDLVSGGKNGRIFVMRGVGSAGRLGDLRRHLARPLDASTAALAFGALRALHAQLGGGMLPEPARALRFQELCDLAAAHPEAFRQRRFDLDREPHGPFLAAQFCLTLLEAAADSGPARNRIADVCGLDEGHRRLLVDLGVLFVDNATATPEHLAAMHRLLTAFPRGVWDVQVITARDWLGPGGDRFPLSKRTGVNIFAIPLDRRENSFAADAPRPGVTDVFLICLAHEIAHNMLDTVGRRLRPELYERKFADLARAAGPDVVFHDPPSRGIDREATRAKFRELGAWDGQEATWDEAWKSHFRSPRHAPRFDRAHIRGNLQFFLDAPQEGFATLANQYVADSALMLELAKVRWDAGFRSPVNQFLLVVDYLSGNTDAAPTYVLVPGGNLDTGQAALERDGRNRITRIRLGSRVARFGYEGEGDLVTSFDLAPPG